MKPEHLIERTKLFAVNVIKMTHELPRTLPSRTLSDQIIRAATSVGANYRGACRSKSVKDFIYKLKVVEEELDESVYWLEVIGETHLYMVEKLYPLKGEAIELMKIVVKSLITVKNNQKKKHHNAKPCAIMHNNAQ
ncbi:MAG: four helix bundle protein [Bacteroidales bacterium]|nr:four helix bundle protein [Bacteroidales bacterium]